MDASASERSMVALDLVGKAYEAAADGRLWPQFLEGFAEAAGGEGTVLWLHDAKNSSADFGTSSASFASHVRIEQSALDSYERYYTYKNLLLAHVDALPEGASMVSSEVVTERDFLRSEFYSDWLRPQGLGYCLGGPVLKRGSVVAMFSTQRLAKRGPFTETDVGLLARLMPHLRRACLLHQRLSRMQVEQTGAQHALELLTTAVWVLDRQGQLLSANRAGRDLDGKRDGLWLSREGRPCAAESSEQQALRRIIQDSIAAGRGTSMESTAALRISRRRRPEPLHVMVYPLATNSLTEGAAAAMFIFDPADQRGPDAGALRILYDLTKTEAHLAAAIARGESMESYCTASRVSRNTARTHLKHVLAKTGTHSQAQLVSLLGRIQGVGHP